MSKAAMNQFTKTFALEAARDRCFAVSLHPGTVDTALSVPFQRGVPEGKLFDASFSASRMLAVLDRIDQERTGGFFDWKGEAIPW
jgi:NAD(P)-dependent dehydrogenase (short-subunit alcohol dehydrogenase family)